MPEFEISVEEDYIESLAKLRNPIIAIEELIWNSLDADATKVDVKLTFNQIGGLTKIQVTDNGMGIKYNEYMQAFGGLGGSAKKEMRLTSKGRIPHGKSGKGRFKAFGLGPSVTWTSRYLENGKIQKFEITGHRSHLKRFEVSEKKELKGKKTGVKVTVSGMADHFPSALDPASAVLELSKRLALYLRKYPGIEIIYDGKEVDPSKLESHSRTYPVVLKKRDDSEIEGELTVIEWNTDINRALYMCDSGGFAMEECPPGIQAPGFNFTAYLKSPLIPELVEENAFAFQEMDPVIISLRDTAKSVLRKHFDEREALKSSDLITQWCEEEVYPYQASDLDPLTTVTRKVFDVCAVKVHEHLKGFEKTEKKNKQLTFRLLKEALENNPESLERILKQILELPPEQQDELARILNRTHISAVINATKTVVGRLDFISSLDSLLFGDFKKDLLERKQLHRILARELWIFGEQYTLGNDDQALTSVLKKHVSILGRDDLAPEDMNNVTDVDGKSRIVDLMLYKQIPQCRPNHFEHLVIELKRPICRLGAEEFTQINKYAFAVADDERFDKSHTKWTFVLIGNDLDAYVDGLCRVKDREYGHVHSSDDGSVNVYVKKWSVILEEVKWRYEFFRKKLELEVSADDGLHYLREKHNDRLPERSSAKKGHSKAS